MLENSEQPLSHGSRRYQVDASENIHLVTENYFLEAFIFSKDTLVVTFEPAGPPFERPDGYRMGWSTTFFRKRGISHLAVKPKAVDWYRKPDLPEAFVQLRESGFFARFGKIVTYGGSMGGFAAMVYARLLGAQTVLALNPQTTLDRDKVPWEPRFHLATTQSWLGPYSDVLTEFSESAKVYVVTDMMYDLDRDHMTRITKDNLSVLSFPFVMHEMPAHLTALRMLPSLIEGAIAGGIDAAAFYRAARGRRRLKRYYNVLLARERVARSAAFTGIVRRHMQKSELLGME